MRVTSYAARIGELAREHPNGIALILGLRAGGETSASWQELDTRSNRMAHALKKAGAGPGVMVVVALPNGVEHVVAAWAGWKTGSCVLPLRYDLPEWERQRLLTAAAPHVVVGDWPEASVRVADAEGQQADPLPNVVPEPAMAIASSGATGAPKLIVRRYAGVHQPRGLRYQNAEDDTGVQSVHLVCAPLYHTNGFVVTHTSLLDRERVVLMDRFDAERAVDLIERHRVTNLVMAPTMLMRIARLPGVEKRDLSSVLTAIQGAAVCPPWVIRKWIDLIGPEHFFVSYGGTEGVGLTLLRGDEWLTHPGSVGRGVRTDVQVLDTEQRPLPPGEVGEVYLRPHGEDGPTHEYRGADPARTTPDGFTTLGDLGWLDADGYLYIADRRTDLIISGGANVYPAEVETALSDHAGVADAVVVGIPDEEWGRRVHAFIQPMDAAPPAIDDLDAHCRARLAAYKIPRSYTFLDAIPRTEAGKVNRSALAERALSAGVPRAQETG